ncbi:hypothetical protein M501DRAFT_931727 [Patellaria atrata CBS 101060]|uniref:Extracellular membrane protein CFEM domain-containing protein n=1 Tax=Patellaria atrata CBS 101060 TaxID=1346257 RepID=A0A9P4SD07_9PEZI|nr:hypothetical protein M501DRAFT_931727 [Patellaria atrata CBS 101060]
MQFKKIFALTALLSFAVTQDIDNDDVPNQCRAICAPVVTLTQRCDRENDDNDSGFLNCVCNATGSSSEIPTCEACVANFDNDGADNDVNDLIRSCTFTRMSYTSGLESATSTGASTMPTTSGSLSTNSAALSSILDAASSTLAEVTSRLNAADPTSTGAGAATALPVVGAGAGFVLAVVGML